MRPEQAHHPVPNIFDPSGWFDGSTEHALLSLQREHELLWSDASNAFLVIGHRIARAVLTDATRFSSARGTGARDVNLGRSRSLNLDDPPRSTELRREVARVLSADRVDALLPRIHANAQELVAEFKARGGGDFLREVAEPLALSTFGALFELDGSFLEDVGATIRHLARAEHLSPERPEVFWAEADARLLQLLQTDAWTLGNDVLGATDALYLRRLVAQTGHESTAHALTSALVTLHEHGFTPNGADELLRLASPLLRFARVATERVELDELVVEPGQRVVIVFPIVNRDPRVFTAPLVFDPTRTPNPHVAFGAGPHACLGSAVTRGQIVALQAALASTGMPTSVEPQPLRSSVTRGFSACEVRW